MILFTKKIGECEYVEIEESFLPRFGDVFVGEQVREVALV